ncbi:FAD dependent dehydrogenase [Streptomyces sp. SID8366]|uniref:FAD binding domain-containing protein n=1 Tax=unclassified Streptomyces TaxID=2593676 RepID=UPI000DB8FD12|nr:FAD binding domain-containing protein [Streptomyces sp. PsTaAH-130]MYU08092.1 FAD dependent dehydrogenase [Streptomyces sp. SID8366]MYU62062.1 FAD dependent dehydrogenase [Streptomyces sp. SID69]RAJ59289.1 CO/xanthine dehydrogenase FAD-binding subunit [Streptomyces sp. PsTaAH-130]
MLLRLPTSVSEAQECLAEGAVPVGGATLVWATWQREGFPELAMSLRQLPQANVIGPETLGAAVLLGRIDDRVPDVLRRAAGTVGTGAVRRAATVGGNLVGSALRCLLPAALALDARATVLESDGARETDLAEVVAKRPLLLGLHWRAPLACAYRKLPADAGGPPPLVVASALHTGDGAGYAVRVAVRDGYEVFEGAAVPGADAEETLEALRATALGDLPAAAWRVVRPQVLDLLARER